MPLGVHEVSAAIDYPRIEEVLGHSFSSRALLRVALTHPSAVEGLPAGESYERLEFLGDSVLGAIVADELYNRFPDLDEGALTRLKVSLVAGDVLSNTASELGIDELVVFGESELGTSARGMHSALENVYEALVGALWLDAGWDACARFVLSTLGPHISKDLAYVPESPKSLLQEITQSEMHATPTYKVVGEEGPAHAPTFTSVVIVNGERIGRGSGTSKKESETRAAYDALRRLGKLD